MPTITALITGASSGIGRAFAERLAAEGHGLLITGRREAVLEEVAQTLRSAYGVAVECFVGELAGQETRDELLARAREHEPFRYLINNVGFGLSQPFLEDSVDAHRAMIAVHDTLATELCHALLPGMQAEGVGTVINVSSLAALVPAPRGATYTATKSYLVRLSESLFVEMRRHGVMVQVLLPGFTHTDFHRGGLAETKRRASGGFFSWMRAEAVADVSLRAAGRGKAVCIPGFRNRVLAAAARFMPRRLLYAAVERGRP
jgi:short-subunit dehydrogenase